MIIKSMSRKEASFSQLIRYIDAGAEEGDFEFTRNLHAGLQSGYVEQFEENAEYLRQRKNGVFLYHEVVSITRSGSVSNERRKEILQEIVDHYVEKRCPDSMVYARVHDEKDAHMHCHLCISSNGVESGKRLRLSHAEFQKAKVDTEKWVLLSYPELGQSVSIGKSREATITNKGVQLKKRTGKLTQKEAFAARTRDVLLQAGDKQEFFALMEDRGLELYQRGKHTGFVERATGRRHRLATLGVADEFELLSRRIDLEGRREVIDYSQGKGATDRVKTRQAEEPPEAPESLQSSPEARFAAEAGEQVSRKPDGSASTRSPASAPETSSGRSTAVPEGVSASSPDREPQASAGSSAELFEPPSSSHPPRATPSAPEASLQANSPPSVDESAHRSTSGPETSSGRSSKVPRAAETSRGSEGSPTRSSRDQPTMSESSDREEQVRDQAKDEQREEDVRAIQERAARRERFKQASSASPDTEKGGPEKGD